jgi:hypothetical protein
MDGRFRPTPSLQPQAKALSSLGRRLVLATLLFCLLFTLAMVTWRTWLAWENNLAEMNSELGLIDQVFRDTLAHAIWEMDRESLDKQLTSVASAAPVGRVVLNILRPGRSPEIIELNRYASGAASGAAPVLHRELVAEPYLGAHEKVGELTIEGDNRLLWERLWGHYPDHPIHAAGRVGDDHVQSSGDRPCGAHCPASGRTRAADAPAPPQAAAFGQPSG